MIKKTSIPNILEFDEIISDITQNAIVQKMKNYKHHCNYTCYEHSLNVAYTTYKLSIKFNLDYISSTRAAMLHDLFLYDWHCNNNDRKGVHGFNHPKIALQNALEQFELNKKEKDAIIKHMWPLTIKLPRFKESYIVSMADKYCALMEICSYYYNKIPKLQS